MIFGCYQIIDIAPTRTTPGGQRKKYYLCKCINCGNIKEINAYKLTHNNYSNCEKCKPPNKLIFDLSGQKFGKLTVIKRSDRSSKKVVWHCKCDCGNECDVLGEHLKTGHTTSCGCVRIEKMQDILVKDLSNQRFGKLTVLRKGCIKEHRQSWICQCDCGNIISVSSVSLTSGKRKSCGCIISVAEEQLSRYLQQCNINYISQYKFADCKDIRPLPFDFAIFNDNKLIMLLELNGEQHYYPFTFCKEDNTTKEENLKDRQKKDMIKQNYCKINNIPLLVIKYTQFNKMERIFDEFYTKIKKG